MKALSPRSDFRTLQTMGMLLLAFAATGCGSLLQRTANLEDDELYLGRGEEFVTDAEYLTYAYEQAGYSEANGQVDDSSGRSGDGFQSSFGYVPQSLRGRSMLRGYMTPYGAAGFGPNPYDPWGSSFYHGYGAYNPGFVDPYNTWGSTGMGGGWGTSGWGINPYVGGAWGMNGLGMNPYAFQPYGGGLYGPNPYGWGYGSTYCNSSGFGGWGIGDSYGSGTPIVVAQRTPIWASSAINSNGGGGRLMTNKSSNDQMGNEVPPASQQPITLWRALDPSKESTTRTNVRSTSNSGRNSWGVQGPDRSRVSSRPSTTRPSTTRPSSNQSNSRGNSWSRPSSSGSSRGTGSSTRPSHSRSSGGSTGRTGGTNRSSGRGGHPTR